MISICSCLRNSEFHSRIVIWRADYEKDRKFFDRRLDGWICRSLCWFHRCTARWAAACTKFCQMHEDSLGYDGFGFRSIRRRIPAQSSWVYFQPTAAKCNAFSAWFRGSIMYCQVFCTRRLYPTASISDSALRKNTLNRHDEIIGQAKEGQDETILTEETMTRWSCRAVSEIARNR